MAIWMWICFLEFVFCSMSFICVKSDTHERRLFATLMANYTTLERPVSNNSFPVDVHLRLILNQLIDVDEKNQVIQLGIWIKYEWNDTNLAWDPNNYGGVKDLRFPANKVWKPDILLYNSVDANFDSTFHTNVIVNYTGSVSWVPPGIVKSSCNIDIKWFPFDDQRCTLKFGSWTYEDSKLNLTLNPEGGWDVTEYLSNGEWDLIGKTYSWASLNTSKNFRSWIFSDYDASRHVKIYDCCPNVFYPDLKFNFTIRRRTLYYGFNMIVPSLLVSLMTLLGFALPVESGEKITLEITILLSVCVFLGMVSSMTPPTSEALPLIGIFFSCNMILVALSVVFSVVVLNLHYRTPDTHTMSPLIRAILLNWLPWILLMNRPGYKYTRRTMLQAFSFNNNRLQPGVDGADHPGPTGSGPENESLMRNGSSKCSPFLDNDAPLGRVKRAYSADVETRLEACLRNALNSPHLMDAGLQSMLLTMQQIYAELKFIAQRMEREDKMQDAKNDWRFAAMVVDRLCLVLFSAFIILSTCAILFSAKHLVA